MNYKPEDGKWIAGNHTPGLKDVRDAYGADAYEKQKASLQKFLCGYFSSGDCDNELGDSISPLGASPQGGKVLKVRWGLPGEGKSGGLRLVVIAYCKEKRVAIARAFSRRDNPKEEDFKAAAGGF